MPLAIVLSLKSTSSLTLPPFLGRATHAWFLDQIRQVDTALAAELHVPNAPRPFTTSPLWPPSATPGQDRLLLSAGETCHLRLTSVSPPLSDLLLSKLAPAWQRSRVGLAGLDLLCTGVALTGAEHPRAGQVSYAELIETAEHSPAPRYVTLGFVSPTTFRRSPPADSAFSHAAREVPLPLPALLFGGLLSSWNAFAPQPLPPELRTFARECVAVASYSLRTEVVEFGRGSRGRVRGFVGTCRFAIRHNDPAWRRRIALLASFAPFSGVGWSTTMGLGQVSLERRFAPH